MNRIKDITKINLPIHSVLMKVNLKNKFIITPDSNKEGVNFDYCEIIALGNNVVGFDIGDIALEVRVGPDDFFKYYNETYAIVRYENIKISVKPDNFDKNFIENSSNLTIN